MNSGIYALVNKRNGKKYIGRSVNLHKREMTHLWLLKNNRHFNVHLQRAWNNGDRFDFVILEECTEDKCNDREIYWIDKLNTMKVGYNLCEGGNTTTGYHFSEETKRKISSKNKGKKTSTETIEKRIKSLKAHMENDPDFAMSHKEKLRQIAIDRNFGHWNEGTHHTEAEKRNLSEKLKGRFVSDEHKKKLKELYSGEKSLTAKLSRSDVIEIRYRYLNGERQIDICKDYPVGPQTIYDIVRNRRWKSVPNTLKELEDLMKNGRQDNGNSASPSKRD